MKKIKISSCLSLMKRLYHGSDDRYEKVMSEHNGWQDTCRDEIKKGVGGIR